MTFCIYLEPVYSIYKIVRKLHLQGGGGVLEVDEVVEEVGHPHVRVVAPLLGPHQVGDHLRRHLGVEVHVLDLAVIAKIDWHPNTVTPAIMPLLVPVPEPFPFPHDNVKPRPQTLLA